MKLNKRYFVGKNKPGIWASVYAYKPNNDEIFKERGEIFAAAFLEGPKDFDASIAGNLLLDILHETYFESEERSTLGALEEAVKAVQNRLMSLVENDESAALEGINFDLVTLVVKGKYFFSVLIGDGSLKIFRAGNLQDLSAGFKDPTGEGRYEVLSSVMEKGDVFFLGTPYTMEAYSEDELFESVNEFSEIGLKNKMIEDDSRLAVLLISNEEKRGSAQTSGTDNFANISLSEEDEVQRGASLVDESGLNQEQLEQEAFTAQSSKFKEVKETAGEKFAEYKERAGLALNLLVDKVKNRSKTTQTALAPARESGAVQRNEPIGEADNSPGKAADITQKSTFQVYLYKATTFLRALGLGIYKFIKEDVLAIKGSDGIYLRGADKRINYRVIIVLVLTLFIVFFVGMRIRRSAVENARIEKENQELADELADEVDTLSSSSVFTIKTPDNITERENVLAQISELEEKINSTSIADDYKEELDGYIQKLGELKLKLLRIIEVNDPELLSDLGATFEGASPSDIAYTDGKIYISDQARNVIYEVSTTGGQREFVASGLDSPRFITTDPDGGLVFLDNSSTALGSVDTGSGSISRFIGMNSDKFTNAVEMHSYEVADNDIRLYLAMSTDPQVQQVKKIENFYNSGPLSRWSGDEYSGLTDIDLLDGKFFVIKAQTGLMRLYVNSAITTNITGLLSGDSLQGVTKMTTDSTYLYFADSVNQRILVFTKSRGENVDYLDLIAQYQYKGDSGAFSNIKDIVVDDSNIYILDGAKVYKLLKSELSPFLY